MAVSDEDFEGIMAGLTEAGEILRGEADPRTYRVHIPDDVDVAAIRKGLGMSQAKFAARYGFSAASVRDWEQNRRRPEAAARVLLMVISAAPEVVDGVLEHA